MRIFRLNLIFCATLFLGVSACSIIPDNYVPAFVKPYKFDIQQGNFVTQQDTAKLQVGMTKDQVRFIMGTPLLNDAFHANRWDYLYRLLRADGQIIQSTYTVIFENNLVANHRGENLQGNPNDALRLNSSTIAPTKDIKKSESAIGGNQRAPVLK